MPVVSQDRLNLSDLDNLVPLFCSTIDAHQDKCTDLESLERQMWNTAQEVLGLQKQAGGKPFLNKAVAALRKAIKVARRLLRFYSHAPHTKATHAATWQELGQRLTTANASAQAAIFFGDPDPHWPTMTRTTLKSALKQCVYDLRETIRTEIRAMEKACLAANIAKSRLHLETGKRGVQRAMGKGVADARMSEVVTTHPSVVIIPLDGLNEEAVRVQCSVTVENVALDTVISADGSRTLRCTPPRLQDVSALLLALESTGILADLERRELTVEDPDDIISALEHFMGMEGKARGMLCRMCSSPEMTCLSRLAPEGRTLCWYCPSCRRCREYVEDLSLYDKVPWPRECVTGYPRVPGGDIPDAYRLRKPIRWEDFLKHLHCMANRKAPGDDMVVSELWKNAPEWAKQLLFAEINAVLMGKPMPDHWRGGTVQFLFKKPPASSLPNWRPICLLNVSYRLYSSIITDRLSRMVEAYGILDQVQEAFRLQRGTRRQIETLLNIIRSAKIQNRSLVIALLDFRNAFNSNDVAACMRILKEYNIPDLDLIEDMYQGAYYQARTSTGRFTARIPLTRGTKQGDPLSPLIFNLTVNMLVRMLKQSGHSFQCLLNSDGLRLRGHLRSTARLFADDTAMVAHSVHSSNALMIHVELFCDYTNAAVRPEKCDVAGIDSKGKPMDVSGVRYKGTPLPVWSHGRAVKYLGAHISMDLTWKTEKNYVWTKMSKAVEQLKYTCYTRSQKMMLFNMCVVPVFRYSAPLVPWTWAELRSIDKLWSRAVKYSLRLPLSFDLAPILLGSAYGGLGLEPAASYMLKEVQIHVKQCLAREDDVDAWLRHVTRETMRLLGMAN